VSRIHRGDAGAPSGDASDLHFANGGERGEPPFGHDALLDLMAYADGELEGEAAARVDAWVARDEVAARWVEEFRTLSECISVTEGARRPPEGADTIADAVMAKVGPLSPDRPNAEPKVVRIRRAFAAGAVSTVFALAAGWWLFFRTWGPMDDPDRSAVKAPVAVVSPPPSAKASPAESSAVAVQSDPGGVELEQVESPTREISVFYVPALSGESASSIVVWVGEDSKAGTK